MAYEMHKHNDPTLREFVHEFWHSVNPSRKHSSMDDESIRSMWRQRSDSIADTDLMSIDTDALLNVVLDRSLLDFGFDYTCFEALDNKLLLSPLESFADLCWRQATRTDLARPKSQPQLRTAPAVERKLSDPGPHLERAPLSPLQSLPESAARDDDWFDEAGDSDEDEYHDDDDGRTTPTPSLSYSDDDSVYEDVDKYYFLPKVSNHRRPLSNPESVSAAKMALSPPATAVKRTVPPKYTAVEAHYRAGHHTLAYLAPSPYATPPRSAPSHGSSHHFSISHPGQYHSQSVVL